MTGRRALAALACLAAAVLIGGCGETRTRFTTDERMDRGVVYILPGIEGEGMLNHELREGLDQAGLPYALPIHNWGRPIPVAGVVLNQVDILGNRLAAQELAKKVVKYQDAHPGAPVFLVGHSGGGGIAVMAAEALPEGRQVDGLILLNVSLDANYDLTKALAHTRRGIANFWSPGDVAFLVVGTTVMGNVDGARGPAAGAIGFQRTAELGPQLAKLYQVRWHESMSNVGHTGGHFSATNQDFARRWVAPWILAKSWTPPPTAFATHAVED